jgi:hypothetical protein
VLDRLRAEVLDGRGFVLVRGLPVEDRPIAESAMSYWGIGSYFGSARSQNAHGHLLGHVYDLGKGLSATNPNLRSYATAERQNFHIDRCDVVALLCLRRAKSGGLSSIVSSMAVHNVMAQRRPDLVARLYQPFPVDRRQREILAADLRNIKPAGPHPLHRGFDLGDLHGRKTVAPRARAYPSRPRQRDLRSAAATARVSLTRFLLCQ